MPALCPRVGGRKPYICFGVLIWFFRACFACATLILVAIEKLLNILFLMWMISFLFLFLLTTGPIPRNLENTSCQHTLRLHRRSRAPAASPLFLILTCFQVTSSCFNNFFFQLLAKRTPSTTDAHYALDLFLGGFYSFSSVRSFSLRPDVFVPPARRILRISLIFGYSSSAVLEHKLSKIECKTIAPGYPRFFKCRIYAFECDWKLL